ncbi:MAG: biotin/lipoyl-binding protein [Fidelibacterota bacterium]|nr:MAG: biotin/lipoyl-binding protein [Candidatus Neomarinimicrobiota bacterium]
MILQATVADRVLQLNISVDDGKPRVEIEGHQPQLDLVKLSPYSYSLLIDGQSHHLSIRPSRDGYMVDLRRRTYHICLQDELDLTIEKMGLKDAGRDRSGHVTAPIPGLITAISVRKGDKVVAGDQLLVLEAMKMENEIAAPMSGTIGALHIATGDTVEKGARLVDIHVQ